MTRLTLATFWNEYLSLTETRFIDHEFIGQKRGNYTRDLADSGREEGINPYLVNPIIFTFSAKFASSFYPVKTVYASTFPPPNLFSDLLHITRRSSVLRARWTTSRDEEWANRVSARTGCGRKGTRVRRLRIFLHLARGRSMYRAFLATNYIFSTVMATCVRSVCVCVCVQNHSSSLWLGRASRALYTIIVKNFRKIVSRNTCSFLEMLGRVEDPCAFASRIPAESEFRWIFFSSSPVTLAGRGFPVLLYQRSLVGSEIFWNTDIIERSFWIHDTREKFPLHSKRELTSGKVISPRISSSRRIFDVSFGEIFEYTEYTDGRYKLLQTDCV